MHALLPPKRTDWLPPLKFYLKPYLELSRSLSEALAELEQRYPSRRVFTVDDRQLSLLKRRPR